MDNTIIKTALRLTTIAFLLACLVVSLGAFTRLVHAGLGCPDWPGCYGHLTWPTTSAEIAAAEKVFPEAPVETDKTWPEMVHRYCAGSLGLLMLAVTCVLFKSQHQKNESGHKPPLKHAFLLLAIIFLQAAFGMWTVTLKLWPQVVTAHLLGGFTTLTLIWLLRLRLKRFLQVQAAPLNPAANIGSVKTLLSALIVLVALQISLGGWTSANYAAMACPDLPTCHGQWLPEADFKNGFNFAQSIGPNYLGGQLDGPARTAIHISHRLGAIVVTLVTLLALFRLARLPGTQVYITTITGLLITQLCLGLANVLFALPLAIAVAHNGVGALFLLAVVTTRYQLQLLPTAQSQLQPSKVHSGGLHHEPANHSAV
ncbi:COX15/CtaA family protein [Halioxenophilus aromaticivorans]|uniref:COX15/CtaA family protein n=1 Tax=Halioxenophilus aromaticivorans TaxID=1306992 RepID=A0AAV3U8C3_9ALTE